MGKVYVGDLLRIGHKLWYRVGCGPGMPGPYRVVGEVGGIGKVRGRHVCRPYGQSVWWVAAAGGYGRGKYLLAHRAEKLYTDTIIMYGWNEP